MSAPSHPYFSEQVTPWPAGSCARCGSDVDRGAVRCKPCSRRPTVERSDTGWMEDAACLGLDIDVFYPTGPASIVAQSMEYARRICHRCPVVSQCLADALATETASTHYGMRGGMTPRERHDYAAELGGVA